MVTLGSLVEGTKFVEEIGWGCARWSSHICSLCPLTGREREIDVSIEVDIEKGVLM